MGVWMDSSVTTSRPCRSRMTLGIPVHVFSWSEKSLPLLYQGEEGQDGTGSAQPGSAQDLAHIKLSFGLTTPCLALRAIARAKAWQQCPPCQPGPLSGPPSLQRLLVRPGVSPHLCLPSRLGRGLGLGHALLPTPMDSWGLYHTPPWRGASGQRGGPPAQWCSGTCPLGGNQPCRALGWQDSHLATGVASAL